MYFCFKHLKVCIINDRLEIRINTFFFPFTISVHEVKVQEFKIHKFNKLLSLCDI